MTDYTRGDSPVYDGYRDGWKDQENEELRSRIEELEAEIEQLREANRWVSTKERIPTEEDADSLGRVEVWLSWAKTAGAVPWYNGDEFAYWRKMPSAPEVEG